MNSHWTVGPDWFSKPARLLPSSPHFHKTGGHCRIRTRRLNVGVATVAVEMLPQMPIRNGDPPGTRTLNFRLKRAILYAIELASHEIVDPV